MYLNIILMTHKKWNFILRKNIFKGNNVQIIMHKKHALSLITLSEYQKLIFVGNLIISCKIINKFFQ